MEHTARVVMPVTPEIDLDRIIDLYYYESVGDRVALVPGGAGAYCYAGASTVVPLGGTNVEGWVDGIAGHILSTADPDAEDFRTDYGGRSWRVCRDMDRITGCAQVSLRRLPNSVPLLTDLQLGTSAIRTLLSAPWLNAGGLVLFSGLTGQGKTTLASATVRTRLEKYGGRGVSVEDVLELPLEGVWGDGSFHQIQVDYHSAHARSFGFPGAVRRAHRAMPATHPALLYIGEVRDAETATEVVKAASNGMVVVTTIHAGTPAMALMRLISLAEAAMGDTACTSVAQSLRMVVHNRLTYKMTNSGWNRGQFDSDILVSDGPSHAVAVQIAKRAYSQLANLEESQRQKVQQASQGVPAAAHTLLRALGTQGS